MAEFMQHMFTVAMEKLCMGRVPGPVFAVRGGEVVPPGGGGS
jgi:hypothetical protein